MFSLGCVLYTLVTGMVPFAGLQANDEMVEDTAKLQLMLDKVQQPGEWRAAAGAADLQA